MSRARKSPGVVDRKLAEGGGSSGGVVCCQYHKAKAVGGLQNALLTKSCRHPSHLKIVMVLGRFPASLFFQPSRRSTGPDTGEEQVVRREKERVPLDFRSFL